MDGWDAAGTGAGETLIEQGIYFALGCIVTALAAMMFAPVFWNRAMRLSRKRLQLQIPVSMQEIYAERDGLRAEFAVERLRVEQAAERVHSGKAADMAEIGRRSVEVARLGDERVATRAELASLSDLHAAVQAEVSAATAETTALRAELEAAQARGSLARSELTARHAEVVAAQADAAGARANAAEALARHQAEVETLRDERARLPAAPSADAVKLQALEEELAAARDREKSLHLQNSLKAEKGRLADRALGERLERLESENAALTAALDEARRSAATIVGDAGLRESIHALGLAVAAMSREEGRPRLGAGERDELR